MAGPVESRDEMLAQMAPRIDQLAYCFMVITPEIAPQALGAAIGTFREDEGVTAIVPEDVARELGADGPAFARITLMVHSSLNACGLTAAVSNAFADHGIACNMVAAYHHDHIFVPQADGGRAMSILQQLSLEGR